MGLDETRHNSTLDEGHDDAYAILLATNSPELNLLGISIVHGNDTVDHCALNAKRFLWACGIKGVPVYKGISCPIVRPAKFCPEIHGLPGEDGVAGMCGFHFPDDKIFVDPSNLPSEENGILKMVETIMNYPEKVTIVATGCHTNLAIALRLFPKIKENISKICFMGGAIGIGNTGLAAEFNMEVDPEASHIVIHSGIPLIMVPLEVTHQVLVTNQVLQTIAKIDQYISKHDDRQSETKIKKTVHPHVEYDEIFRRIEEKSKNNPQELESSTPLKCSSQFATCCVELLSFFKSTYKTCFSFDSPPLHDPSAVFYLINPEAFKTIDVFLDVEISSEKCLGRTYVDIHGITKKAPNAKVCYQIDVDKFWDKMFSCIKIANENSPLNI